MRIFKKSGQTSIEYATMIIVVIAALLAMQSYFKRGVQGRWRSSADGVGDQYDPMFTEGSITHEVSGSTLTTITTQDMDGGIQTLRNDNSTMVERKSGYTRVDAE